MPRLERNPILQRWPRKWLIAACSIVLAGQGFPGQTFADQTTAIGATGIPARADENITIYDRIYFADFNAITAEDLLKRIPGIQDLLPQLATGPGTGATATVEQRGFGANEEIFLFNGRRLSGKANDAGEALKRVQARQVSRVEVIKGSVPGLDVKVGAKGVLINVVLEDELAIGVGSWEANATFWSSGRMRPGGSLAYTGTSGAINYTISAKVDSTLTRRVTRDDYLRTFDTKGPPFAKLNLIDQNLVEVRSLVGNLSYAFANGDLAKINGRFANDNRELFQPADDFLVSSAGVVTYTGSRLQTKNDHNKDNELELGGDYEHALNDGSSLRGLFVVSYDRRYNEALFYSTPLGSVQRNDRLQISDPTRREKIVRATYNTSFSKTQSLEAGAEIAFNSLDQTNRRVDIVGGLSREIALFNSSTVIKEKRLETFVNYSWKFTPTLSFIGALETEYSKLDQDGRDVNSSRTFFFLKPRIDARYDLTSQTQIRARVLRTISQLDFGNFVSTFVNDDTRLNVLLAGNPNLVPEKAWTYESTYEHRFANRSSISVRGFYNSISDQIDKIRIQPGVAGTGNIGSGRSYGVEMRAGLRLDTFGLKRAAMDVNLTLQDSTVTDAFTLKKRELNSFRNYLWSVSYRQDLDWQNFAYGATITGEDKNKSTDIDYEQTFEFRQGEMTAYGEIRPGQGSLTFRVEATRILNRGVARLRFQYQGDRANGVLTRTELRDDTFDRSLRLIIKGTF